MILEVIMDNEDEKEFGEFDTIEELLEALFEND